MTVEIEAWLIVSQTPGIGSVKFHRLLKQIGQPKDILKATTQELSAAGLNADAIRFLRNPPPAKISSNLNWLKAPNHTIRTLRCQQYPKEIKELRDAPPLLYIKGDESLLKEPQIAVVGTRKPTPSGQANAKKFSQEIVRAGILINSGMASGIDTVAHETALASGSTTVAVIATGPDKIYPAKNKPLAENIAAHGVLVSEFPVGTTPIRANFPLRNRLISALSLGVVVIEAGIQSGALITARLAVEQGKDVFAVPGSIHNPKAQGCHHLIQQGAKLVQKTEEILLELQPQLEQHLRSKEKSEDSNDDRNKSEHNRTKLSDTHKEILEAMGYDPVDIDTLAARCGLSVQTVSVALLTLELENYVGEDNGVYVRIR